MHPQCRITIDGALASGVFMERLISCEVTDKEGVSSDTVSIDLADWPPAAIPRKGAIIRVWMGYGIAGMVYRGAYTADEIEAHCLPYRMTITGKSADLRKEMKANKERHWDKKTVSAIVSEIAGEHGLAPLVDGSVGAHQYEWMGQQDESDIHFLERLAKRHNAIFAVKDGKLIFARRGAGMTAGGAGLTGIVVTKADLIEGTCKVRFSDRNSYKEVAAYWQDKDEAKRVEVKEPSDPVSSAIYRLGEPFASEDEAKKAAAAKAKELKRAGTTTSCEIIGNPAAFAGAPMTYAGVRPGVDGIPFIIETARLKFSKDGFTTTLDGKVKG